MKLVGRDDEIRQAVYPGLGDFKQQAWARTLIAPFDAVAMQAVHEIRHKRHVPERPR